MLFFLIVSEASTCSHLPFLKMMEWPQPVLASGVLCKILYGLVPCPYPRWQLFHSLFFFGSVLEGRSRARSTPSCLLMHADPRVCVRESCARAECSRPSRGCLRHALNDRGRSERARRTASRTLRAKEGPADRRGILRR